jgi:hypothetical protein
MKLISLITIFKDYIYEYRVRKTSFYVSSPITINYKDVARKQGGQTFLDRCVSILLQNFTLCKSLNLYFNVNASPTCCRNVHVLNGDAKAQRTSSGTCMCNLNFRTFHPRQKVKSQQFFASLPYLISSKFIPWFSS